MAMRNKAELTVLDEAMAEKGMSVLALANAIGKHPSLVYQIRRGEKVPSLETALRMSAVLDRSVEQLFGQLISSAAQGGDSLAKVSTDCLNPLADK
jgi:transcriptional regulator with XRE-family HTH domain